jgi:tRNA dimethylallyltransferase
MSDIKTSVINFIRENFIMGRSDTVIDDKVSLIESGISSEKLIFYGLEYKFTTEYLLGNLTYDEMTKRLEIAIHQFAKRQMTFFRSMERKGIKINWLNGMQTVEDMTTQKRKGKSYARESNRS